MSRRKQMSISTSTDEEKKESSRSARVFRFVCGDSFEDYFHFFRKLVWLAAVAICCYFMLFQMEQCLGKLSNPPITTQSRIHMLDALSYPAVTFCYKNKDDQGFDGAMLLSKYNISYWYMPKSGIYRDTAWGGFYWGTKNMSEVWQHATYDVSPLVTDYYIPMVMDDTIEDFLPVAKATEPVGSYIKILSSSLNQVPGSARGLVHHVRYYNEHGKCITFEQPKDATKAVPGEGHGYKFGFFIIPNNDVNNLTRVGGWDIFIHDPDQWWTENQLMSYRGDQIHVTTGKEIHMKLSESTFNSLDRQEDPCKMDPGKVSYTECLEKCRWRHIAEQVGVNCSLPFMVVDGYNECDNYDAAILAMLYYRQWIFPNATSKKLCQGRCTKSCKVKLYTTQIIKEVLLVGADAYLLSNFHIYFPTGAVQVLQEEWGYDMTLFIADFGGSLGFLLGVSILSVLEIVEGITLSGYRMYVEKREKKERKKQQQESEDTK